MVTDLFNKVSDDLYHQESESEAPLEWERRYTSMGLSLFRISMQENLLMLDQDGESYETSSDKSHSTRTIGYTLTRSLIASAIFERQTLIYMGEAGPSVLFSPNVDVTIKPVYGLGSGDFHVRESFTGNLACRGLVDLATGEENMSLALDVFAPDTILDEYPIQVFDQADASITFEVTGDQHAIDRLIDRLTPFGVKKMARSGVLALYKESELQPVE